MIGGVEFGFGFGVKDMVIGVVVLVEFIYVIVVKYLVNVVLYIDYCFKDKLDSYVWFLLVILV